MQHAIKVLDHNIWLHIMLFAFIYSMDMCYLENTKGVYHDFAQTPGGKSE